MKLTTHYPGLSILEIREKYKHLMYPQTWYDNQDFAKEHAPAGVYELRIPEDGYSKTFAQQEKLAAKGEEVVHPAVLLYALFEHFEKTGERVLERTWARTGGRGSGGDLVVVGRFDSGGAFVGRDAPGAVFGYLGVCLSRMTDEKMNAETMGDAKADSLSGLETRVAKLEEIVAHHNLGI